MVDELKKEVFMKKYFIVFLMTSLIFTGCSTKTKSSTVESSTIESTTIESSSTQAQTTESVKSTKPINYTWDPTIYSKAYVEYLGKDTEKMYQEMVEAILNREDSFSCNRAYYEQIPIIIKTCFPCAEYFVDYGTLEDNKTVSLKYTVSKKKQQSIIKKFGERVEELICGSVYEGDSDTVAAILFVKDFSMMTMRLTLIIQMMLVHIEQLWKERVSVRVLHQPMHIFVFNYRFQLVQQGE